MMNFQISVYRRFDGLVQKN